MGGPSRPVPLGGGGPSGREEARRLVEAFSQAIAAETIGVQALADTLKGAKKFIEQAAREYAERFLYELIQNSYDAHPRGAAGTVKVILDLTEGEHGTLYIANTGAPFTDRDFRSICEVAQSSKRPGQGIGNKGVGFKSVLQISEWPEIYSRSHGSTDEFDGYCFTFARPADVLRFAGGDAEQASVLTDRLSPYGLPVPIEAVSPWLGQLADQAFSSVVRLPLRNVRALKLAQDQLGEISASSAPVLLFLDRIATLTLETHSAIGTSQWTSHREVVPLDTADGVDLAEIDLGPAGRFLMLSSQLEKDAFLEAIERSIEARLVDDEWQNWDGDAFVSIALPLDGAELSGRLYCYLPMGGDESSPLNGYLNAPFAVTLSRQSLVPSVPLNDFLLDAAARTAARASSELRSHPAGRLLVPDLIAWRDGHAERIIAACASLDATITHAPLLPTASGSWGSYATTYRWIPSMTTLTPMAISEATDCDLLDPKIGPARCERLATFASELPPGFGLEPKAEIVADWAEAVARALVARAKHSYPFDGSPWAGLYDDLAGYFRGRTDAHVLRGRELLVDEDLRLQVTWGGSEKGQDASIFFPLREIADPDETLRDATIPESLGRYLAYVHSGIPSTRLNTETRRYENREGRDFLERAGLVRMPRTRDLLERISRILKRRRGKQLHSDALRLVFNLTAGRLYPSESSLTKLYLRVPTTAGEWISASLAHFSEAWDGTQGRQLSRLIRQSAGVSRDLNAIASRLLAAPDAFGFRLEHADRWIPFLRAIGVRDGLWPESLETSATSHPGWWWTNDFGLTVPLAEEERAIWTRELAASRLKPSYPNTEYRLVGPIMRAPASADYEALPTPARQTYGRLIAMGLRDWPDEAFSVRVARPRSGIAADRVSLPSPALAFLRSAQWMPTTRPGEAGAEDFVSPARAWHYRDEEGDAQPTFMPLLVSQVRTLLDDSPAALERATTLGIHVWNEPRHAIARLRELSRVFRELDVPDTLIANFRKACERTWATIARTYGLDVALPLRNGDVLIVGRRGRLGALVLGQSDEAMHVLVDEDRLASAVLDSLDFPVLQADPKDGRVLAAILRPLFGERLRSVGAADVRVLVDGVSIEETAGDLLVERNREWLTDLIALTLEFKASSFNRQFEQRIRAALETLRSIRLHAGARAEVTMGSNRVDLPPHVRRVFAISDATRPRIAFEGTADPLDWSTLELLAPKIGELVGASNALENAVIVLSRRRGGGQLFPPSDLDYSAAFEQSVDRVIEVRRAHRGMVVGLLYLLRPVLHVYLEGDDPIGDSLATAEAPSEPAELAALLTPFEARFPAGVTAASLVEVASSSQSLGDLREKLQIDYAAFNGSLRALAGEYEPILNGDGHQLAFRSFLARHHGRLLWEIRGRFMPIYDAGEIPAGYAAATREVTRAQLGLEGARVEASATLAPDLDWLEIVDLPSDHLIEEHVQAWIEAVAPAGGASLDAPPVEEVRATNRRFLTAFVRRAAPTLSVWARKESDLTPPDWIATASAELLTTPFLDAGLLDFRLLDDRGAIEWARQLGLWPDPLPETVDAEALSITPDDLAAQASEDQRKRWEWDLDRRTVALDGRPMALDVDDPHELIDAVRHTISEDLLRTPSRPRDLKVMPLAARRLASRGAGRNYPGRSRRLTSDQTELIGFMGELVAFEWLRKRYGVGAEAWRSRYRRFLFTDHEGDDGLGFDFEIVRRRPLRFEVKATTTDELSFEMSEAELRVAGEMAANDLYRILFISRVNDSLERSLIVLPNPLSESGYGRYRPVGRGIQYEFAVDQPDHRRARG